MRLATDESSPALKRLLQAIDALDAHGFVFWEVEECDESVNPLPVSEWAVQFRDFPAELPILESEIQLLTDVFHEIMKLGGFEGSS